MEESTSNRDAVLSMFRELSQYLDDHNDRYERLVKISRDVTIQSKRAIFQLHRSVVPEKLDNDSNEELRTHEIRAANDAHKNLKGVQKLWAGIASELENQDVGRYVSAISPGLQEYIEALSFAHFIDTGGLISYTEAKGFLPENVPFSHQDYVLGVSDVTGELMRYAISSISVPGGGRYKPSQVSTFVRDCAVGFEKLVPYIQGLSKKQSVTSESLRKIERAAYDVTIRGSEYPEQSPILIDFSRGGQQERNQREHDEDIEYY